MSDTEETTTRTRTPNPLTRYQRAHDKAERARRAHSRAGDLAERAAKAQARASELAARRDAAETEEQEAYTALQVALADLPVSSAE